MRRASVIHLFSIKRWAWSAGEAFCFLFFVFCFPFIFANSAEEYCNHYLPHCSLEGVFGCIPPPFISLCVTDKGHIIQRHVSWEDWPSWQSGRYTKSKSTYLNFWFVGFLYHVILFFLDIILLGCGFLFLKSERYTYYAIYIFISRKCSCCMWAKLNRMLDKSAGRLRF